MLNNKIDDFPVFLYHTLSSIMGIMVQASAVFLYSYVIICLLCKIPVASVGKGWLYYFIGLFLIAAYLDDDIVAVYLLLACTAVCGSDVLSGCDIIDFGDYL